MKKKYIIILSMLLLLAVVVLSVLYIAALVKLDDKETGNLEIERKYIVDVANLPDAFNNAEVLEIVQTYINYSPEMRIRKINDLYYYFTMKTPKDDIGLVRDEIEIIITKEEYEEMLDKKEGNTIYKTRYQFTENGVFYEVDIYSHQLEGLAVVEVEFKSIKEANRFKKPIWIGLDVTSDVMYKNVNLAYYGMPN